MPLPKLRNCYGAVQRIYTRFMGQALRIGARRARFAQLRPITPENRCPHMQHSWNQEPAQPQWLDLQFQLMDAERRLVEAVAPAPDRQALLQLRVHCLREKVRILRESQGLAETAGSERYV
jgi:hypothetical protein